MTPADVTARFAEWGYVDALRPKDRQADLLASLVALYEKTGVLDWRDPQPLCEVCPNAGPCWRDASPRERRAGRDGDGALMLPWIGADYRPGRDVVIVGVNPNIAPADPTDLLLEHGITWHHAIASLAAGEERRGGSRFAFGSMRSAAALLDLADGRDVVDRTPEELAPLVARTARLQAIKCVPRRAASRPYGAMWHHCPSLLLGRELDVLRPRVVLALGRDAAWAVGKLDGYAPRDDADRPVGCAGLERDGWRADVLATAHPAARGGKAQASEDALQALARDLGRV